MNNTIKLPKSVVLELTYKCNHKCLFCSCPWDAPNSRYVRDRELSVEDWYKAISSLYDLGVEAFSLSGGEAILKDGFEDILRYIRSEAIRRDLPHYSIVLISNGRSMKHEYLELFKELDVHLSMSLPGYTTFKDHTGVDNADGVLYWFEEAKKMGLLTTVNVTVTKKNLHELFETISLGLIHGATDVLINRFLPGGRGLSYRDELALTTSDVNTMLDTAEEVLQYSNRHGNVGTEIPICSINDLSRYKQMHLGHHCAAAKGFFVIDPSGRVRTCNHSPKVVGNIFDDCIISDIGYWNVFAESNYQPETCRSCSLKKHCDCGCREVANILKGSPKYLDCSIDTHVIE